MSHRIDRSKVASDGPSGNPFATRYTRPGALPPLDRDGTPLDVPRLAARIHGLAAAAILGPHGHGKTTLLVALARVMTDAGQPVAVLRARGWADAAGACTAIRRLPPGGVVCIDGWDALGPLRWFVRLAARWHRRRLLVTTHRPTSLPSLHNCTTTPALLRALVERLPDPGGTIGADDIAAAFWHHAGDLRAALFDLYDRFERRPESPPA